MSDSHVFDHTHAKSLDSEERKTWQNVDDVLDFVELKPEYVAADLGCGSGYFTVPLANRVKTVYGIDIQQEMLKHLEQKIQTQRIGNIQPMLSTNNLIPLENDSVDLLLTVNTLHEFPNRQKTLTEIHRVLKQGGLAVIVDFKKEDTPRGPPVEIRVSSTQAIQLFEKMGFVFVKSRETLYHYVLVFQKK
jgi:ubiquinone/menaquinone biosynthesis C-methylase UbiE